MQLLGVNGGRTFFVQQEGAADIGASRLLHAAEFTWASSDDGGPEALQMDPQTSGGAVNGQALTGLLWQEQHTWSLPHMVPVLSFSQWDTNPVAASALWPCLASPAPSTGLVVWTSQACVSGIAPEEPRWAQHTLPHPQVPVRFPKPLAVLRRSVWQRYVTVCWGAPSKFKAR